MTSDLVPIRVRCSCPNTRTMMFLDRETAGMIAARCGGVLDPYARLGEWRCAKCKAVVTVLVKDVWFASTGI